MTLELKNVAPYLPYSLKVFYYSECTIETMIGLNEHTITTDCDDCDYSEIKLILKPLSDLKEFSTNEFHNRMLVKDFSFDEVQKLIADHYDIFGLIEQGLAIDINTLNK